VQKLSEKLWRFNPTLGEIQGVGSNFSATEGLTWRDIKEAKIMKVLDEIK
jgi:hypothetical protein